MKQFILQKVIETGVIPVIRANSGDEAVQIIEAIKRGGISTIEITMTVPNAIDVIKEVVAKYGDEILVGAGTVLDAETARACILAGAKFVISPALNLETIACCKRYSVVSMPGALTPTEIVTAWTAGADFVKVFPANSLGGASYIKSLKAPLPQIEMIPTGGVSLSNVADFIKAGSSAVGVGGELVDLKALKDDNADLITQKAREFVEKVKFARQND